MKRVVRDTGPDFETVLKVRDRDGQCCVCCGALLLGQRGVNWVIHHRRPRAMGGSRRPDTNQPQNLLSLCASCHEFIESHRGESYDKGWLVSSVGDPAASAVLVEQQSRWVYLDADFGYSDNPPLNAGIGDAP